MTRPTDPLFDQRIADWLEDDPVQAPGQVLEIVLAALPSIPRRRAIGARWRLNRMPGKIRWPAAAAAVIAVMAVAGALYLNRPSQPAAGGPSATPGASSSPSQSASPTAVPARPASWTATGSMARSRESALAVPLQDGKVLVVGGNSNVADPAAEVYDPRTGTWTATGPMVITGWSFAAARLLDGHVLVASADGTATSAELYDPSTGSWTATGSMGTARYATSLTLLDDGKVLLAAGDTVTHFFNPSVASAEVYDPATGSWTPTGSMSTVRSWHTATLLGDGKVLVVGGMNENDTQSYGLASAELYDPGTGTWTPAKDMTQVRSSHSATLLGDGRILVVGGFGSEGSVRSAELYDPTSGSWTLTESLRMALYGFTTALMSDGRVLVAGGFVDPDRNQFGQASASAEIYDPNTGTWAATIDMTQVRAGHTATLLPDGMVLVAGGISEQQSNYGDVPAHGPGWLASAELYDPGSGTR